MITLYFDIKMFPQKVNFFFFFLWRLLLNCLPTNDNLFKRRVISATAPSYVGACVNLDAAAHFFFLTTIFIKFESLFYVWLGFVMVTSHRISDRLIQFGDDFSKYKRGIILLIWFSSVCVLWKERNSRIFKNKYNSIQHLFDKIKMQSCEWLKAKHTNFTFNYHI